MTDQSAIEAAAERLDTPGFEQSDWAYERDKILCVQGFLADRAARREQEAEDAKPIDEAWLTLSGFVHHRALDQWSIGRPIRVIHWPGNPGGEWLLEIGHEMQEVDNVRTRGDIRHLIEALGVKP